MATAPYQRFKLPLRTHLQRRSCFVLQSVVDERHDRVGVTTRRHFPSIDHQHRPGHKTARVRCEIDRCSYNLIRLTSTSERDLIQNGLHELLRGEQTCIERSVEEARGDAIDANLV